MAKWSPRGWSIRTKSIALAIGYFLALGTVYATFTDPTSTTSTGLSFAGAGVNAKVAPRIN